MKRWLIFLVLSLTLVAGGCWDRVEIIDRGLVMATALDLPANQENPVFTEKILTMQILNPQGSQSGSTPAGGEGKQESPTSSLNPVINVAVKTNTLFQGIRSLAAEVHPAPFFGQMQLVVFGEHMARAGLEPIIDWFIRDDEVRTNVLVMVTPGQASKVLEIKPPTQPIPALYLSKLEFNEVKTGRIGTRTTLNQLSQALHEKRPFILPQVVVTGEKARISGAGVFKHGKLIGWLDEAETEVQRMLTGHYRGGTITTRASLHGSEENGLISTEIITAKPKINCILNGQIPQIEINIKVNGVGSEHEHMVHQRLNREDIKLFDAAFSRELEQQISTAVNRVQQEYRADIFQFGKAVARRYPQYWKANQHDWDNIFARAVVTVKADVMIRRVGIIR